MKKFFIKQIFLISALSILLVLPIFTYSLSFKNTMVPCGWDGARDPLKDDGSPNGNGVIEPREMCNFYDFIKMIGGLVNGTIIIVSAYAAVSFMYAGYAYLTSGGSQEKVGHAKSIFTKVLTGYIIILIAWAFIYMIEQAFFSDTMKQATYLNENKPLGN